MTAVVFGVAAAAVFAAGFTVVTAAFAVPLTGDLAATALEVLAAAVDFTAVAVLLLFADAAGVFAGFFIAFAIESTAN
ncbi:hypothetical protein HBDW_07540 [Herbaspirillum sp. DW155]|uniref:hypothetical protein n=1 Tax=Herbaspirillum sp. DW155 TaxID=3095609 RepID=UPI0030937962|nr:hypothetical protein HBDW_07540 [Herbaspirillum sp. DW155]